MVSVSVRYFFYQPIDEKIKIWPLHFPVKENPNMGKALFDWSIMLQYDVKAKYWLISRKLLGMKFFHPSIRLTTKNHAHLYQFDKPIKSLYFCSFVVCTFSFQGQTKIAVLLFWVLNSELKSLLSASTHSQNVPVEL